MNRIPMVMAVVFLFSCNERVSRPAESDLAEFRQPLPPLGKVNPRSDFPAPIEFDPDGAGPEQAMQVSVFKWSPANAMAAKRQEVARMDDPLEPLPDIDFDIVYQASLGSFILPSGEERPLGRDYEITVVSGFSQKGWRVVNDDEVVVQHTSHGKAVNYFEIYFDPTPDADSLEGTGYNNGTLIFSGDVYASGAFRMPRSAARRMPSVARLDQFGPDNFSGVGTAVGRGRGNLESNPQMVAREFFHSPILRIYFTSQLETPFTKTNPSRLFVTRPHGAAPDFAPRRHGRNPLFREGVNGMGDLQFSPMAVNTFAIDR